VAAVTVARVAPKKTMLLAGVALKFVPVMVTDVPTGPLAGVKFVMVGELAAANVNPTRVAVPPGVVTLTLPEVPDATTAVMLVAETTLNEVAAVPPKLTAVAPVKLVPVMVTVAPIAALIGLNDATVGAVGVPMNVNPARVAVPPGVVTLTLPEVPAATTAVMLVAETTLNDVAAVPPKLTAVAPVKFVPVIVTVAPTAPEVGVKLVIVGTGTNKTVLRNTETVLLVRFATARSALPSPSRSPMETEIGCAPVVKSTLAAKELRLMLLRCPYCEILRRYCC